MRKGFAPIVIILVVAALTLGGGVWYYSHRFPLKVGTEPILQGTVLENVTIESQSDGPAYFFLLTDKGTKIKVVYTPGMSCYNYEPITIGFSTKAGDKVEVRGKAISANELFTCESKDYYIKILGPGRENIATSTTANWRTYRNEEYGFEVRYPLSWSINLRSAFEAVAITISDGSLAPASITILPKGEFDHGLPMEVPEKLTYKLDGVKFSERRWDYYRFIEIAEEHERLSSDFRIEIVNDTESNIDVDQILSTFKFISLGQPSAGGGVQGITYPSQGECESATRRACVQILCVQAGPGCGEWQAL